MQRIVTGVLVSALLSCLFVVGADAQRRRNRREARVPHSEGIAADMQGLEWGWSKRQLMSHFRRRIQEEWRPRLAKAPGAIEEDRMRHRMSAEIQRIRDSYFEFDGATSGYDSGFLRFEFTHNNGEAMMKVQTENSDDYYFFINDRLWKWYRALHADVFAGATFDQFAAALERRYGSARRRSGTLHEQQDHETQWLEWQDSTTRARAIDNTHFYGFYSLVFEEKRTLSQLAELRTTPRPSRDRGHALVDSVTSGDPAEEPADPHADIVDRLTKSRGSNGSGSR